MSDGNLRALVEEMREELRQKMLRTPITDAGETFDDGFFNGIAHSISKIDTLTAAASHLSASSNEGWRTDLENAPRDYTSDVDLWAGGQRYTDCAWMRPTYGPKEPCWCHHAYDDCNGPVYNEVKNPTHWMPLPPPPSPGEEQTPQSMEQGR